jgi:DNA modification methylase
LWICGAHRVICGDATNADHVGTLLAGSKPHLMVTDPPYGVDYDPAWRTEAAFIKTREIQRGALGKDPAFASLGEVTNDHRADWRAAWALFPGEVAYVWCASLFSPEVILGLEALGFERRSQIIWSKTHFAISRGHYHWQHEPC